MTSMEMDAFDELRLLARKTAALTRAAENVLDAVIREGHVAAGRAENLRQHVPRCGAARYGPGIARALGWATKVADLRVRGYRRLSAGPRLINHAHAQVHLSEEA